MSSGLDKVKVRCLMPLEYKYLHHDLLNLGNKASLSYIIVIIMSSRVSTGVPLVP